uniref:Uncharacterized protein n=1 Tax=Nonomuraea gerenzanensis TaxID=93944 RepID=A0A1M4ENE5_9ACTN|nr:hypothetical protein BN4615_P9888 [Nonomuraea gerenzanensis]
MDVRIGAGGRGHPRIGSCGAFRRRRLRYRSGCNGAPNDRPQRHQRQPERDCHPELSHNCDDSPAYAVVLSQRVTV